MSEPTARLSEIPEGGSIRREVHGREIALYRIDGVLHAIDAVCPHRGGPLDEADLEDGRIIACPWHGWRFDITTGLSPTHPGRISCHKVRVEGDDVFVELSV